MIVDAAQSSVSAAAQADREAGISEGRGYDVGVRTALHGDSINIISSFYAVLDMVS